MENGNSNNYQANSAGNEGNQATSKTGQEAQDQAPTYNSLLEEAKAIAETNKKLLEDLRKENNRLEAIRSEQILSGNVGQGVNNKQEMPKEETPQDYARKVMEGKVKYHGN